ncbi:hypothetical protein PMAYCL1PPCAC_08383, partial [Pristionchus mayeri]
PLMPSDNEVRDLVQKRSIRPTEVMKEPKEEPIELFDTNSVENASNDKVCKEEDIHDDIETSARQSNSFGFSNGLSSSTSSLKDMSTVLLKSEDVKRTRSSRVVSRPRKYADYFMDDSEGYHKILKQEERQLLPRKPKGFVKIEPLDDYYKIPTPLFPKREPKEEIVDGSPSNPHDQFPARKFIKMRFIKGEHFDYQIETSENGEMNMERRPLRRISRPVKTENMMDSDPDSDPDFDEDSDEFVDSGEDSEESTDYGEDSSSDFEPLIGTSQKKSRSPSRSGRASRVAKMNKTDLECPECDFITRYLCSWLYHLRRKHFTTPYLSGLALLCECGQESVSDEHSRKCDCSNTTVIRKIKGPIRRLTDAKTTPKCDQCDMYPSTILGYVCHIKEHHNSDLRTNGIYLKCACGLKVRSNTRALQRHNQECDARHFS